MCETDGRIFLGRASANYRKKYVVSGGFTVNDLITLRFHAPQTTLAGSGPIGRATDNSGVARQSRWLIHIRKVMSFLAAKSE